MTENLGPLILAQVVHARTKFGHLARCGCGWRCIQQTYDSAIDSGLRHLQDAHAQEGR